VRHPHEDLAGAGVVVLDVVGDHEGGAGSFEDGGAHRRILPDAGRPCGGDVRGAKGLPSVTMARSSGARNSRGERVLPDRSRDDERDERRAARREELLDAAMAAIRRDGPAVSMEAIAAEAGVTKPILYKHFGDRDGLAGAIAGRVAAELVATVGASLGADVPPRQLLHSTVDAYLTYIERDPHVYRFLVSRLGATDGVGAGDDLMSEIGRRVAVVLGEQLRQVGFDSGAAEPWAFGIVGMVHLAGDWWLGTRTMPRARLTEYLCDLLWRGLGGGPGREVAGAP
jgi:AcrR family transcriptional regulator